MAVESGGSPHGERILDEGIKNLNHVGSSAQCWGRREPRLRALFLKKKRTIGHRPTYTTISPQPVRSCCRPSVQGLCSEIRPAFEHPNGHDRKGRPPKTYSGNTISKLGISPVESSVVFTAIEDAGENIAGGLRIASLVHLVDMDWYPRGVCIVFLTTCARHAVRRVRKWVCPGRDLYTRSVRRASGLVLADDSEAFGNHDLTVSRYFIDTTRE